MPVNPIDLQVAIPKTVEISNIKQLEIQKSDIYTEQFSIMYNIENTIKKRRANAVDVVERLYFKEKGKEKVKKDKNKQSKKHLFGHIDIKI